MSDQPGHYNEIITRHPPDPDNDQDVDEPDPLVAEPEIGEHGRR